MNLTVNILSKVFQPKYLLFVIVLSGWVENSFSQNCQRSDFRSINGTCNNLYNGNWGKAGNKLVRELPAHYDRSNPYGRIVNDRPNARALSNAISAQATSIPNKDKLSSFVFTWGQFIDHDLGFVATNPQERANIPLPINDPSFTQDIAFTRSAVRTGTGIFNSREHNNEITSWIDASQVYGSDVKRARWLRTFKDGKLKVSKGNLLPYNTIDSEQNSPIDPNAPEMDDPFHSTAPHFVAGDIRASEQPGLTSLHTLFVREHNRFCEDLRRSGMRNDELMYQIARKRVGALIQHITYHEFLPALGIRIAPYHGYKSNVQPDIMHVFASAAFRIGHTMVTEKLLLLNDDCSEATPPLHLGKAFFNDIWIQRYGIDPILKGLSIQQQEQIDAKIVDGLRNSLFNLPRLPVAIGLDLAAINIQRGRDHGLPSYNTIRAHFTGKKANSFSQINSDYQVWQPLATLYKHNINKIDPWVGMLCEEYVPGSNLGSTMYQILKIQFERLRDGDFYYYENDPFFKSSEVRAINNTKLSTIIKRNTTLNIHSNAFKATRSCTTPSSNPTTSTVILCNRIKATIDGKNLLLDQLPNTYSHFRIYSPSWKYISGCDSNCRNRHIVKNLKNGTYRIFIYDIDGNPICSESIKILSSVDHTGQKNSDTLLDKTITSSSKTTTSSLFPNPAQQKVFVQLSEDDHSEEVQIILYNNYGQMVRRFTKLSVSTTPFQLSVEGLARGMYQVQIIWDNRISETHKLIIER